MIIDVHVMMLHVMCACHVTWCECMISCDFRDFMWCYMWYHVTCMWCMHVMSCDLEVMWCHVTVKWCACWCHVISCDFRDVIWCYMWYHVIACGVCMWYHVISKSCDSHVTVHTDVMWCACDVHVTVMWHACDLHDSMWSCIHVRNWLEGGGGRGGVCPPAPPSKFAPLRNF